MISEYIIMHRFNIKTKGKKAKWKVTQFLDPTFYIKNISS